MMMMLFFCPHPHLMFALFIVVLAALAHGVTELEEVQGRESKYLQISGDEDYHIDFDDLAPDDDDDFTNYTVGAQIPIDFGDTSRSIGVAVGGVGGPGGGGDEVMAFP